VSLFQTIEFVARRESFGMAADILEERIVVVDIAEAGSIAVEIGRQADR
jgi:hypothetical protein